MNPRAKIRPWYSALSVGFLLCAAAADAGTFSTRIIGGQSSAGYPWMAGLHYYDPAAGTWSDPFCGGTLIAPRWVLTAAHCVDEFDATGIHATSGDELHVRLDAPALFDGSGAVIPPAHVVDTVVVHESYGPDQRNDLALLRLNAPVSILPASFIDLLHLNLLNAHYATSDLVQALGWGVHDNENFDSGNAAGGDLADELQSVRLDFLPWSNSLCRNAYGGLPDTVVCARETSASLNEPDDSLDPTPADPDGEDTCFGDSGGPLLLPVNTLLGSTRTTSNWLVGVTSSGDSNCDSSTAPGVYSNLYRFIAWLEQTLATRGDSIVDVSASLASDDPITSRTGFVVATASIANPSLTTAATQVNVRFTTAGATTSVTGHNASRMTCTPDGSDAVCTVTSMAPGEKLTVDLQVNGSFAADTETTLRMTVDTLEYDYRLPNDSAAARLTFTDAPVLDVVLRQGNFVEGKARVNIRLDNLAPNAASDPALTYALSKTVEHRLLDADGTAIACSGGASGFSCPLSPLAGDASRALVLELSGSGTVTVEVEVTATGMTAPASDTLSVKLQSDTFRLTGSSGGGGSCGLFLLVLVAHLRCRSRRK